VNEAGYCFEGLMRGGGLMVTSEFKDKICSWLD
jgi:hypothetical protein